MIASTIGALATAGLLGVTHALEPDHVAGIASLTGRHDDSRRSALAGLCFGLGHVALVVAWLALAYALLGVRSFPAVLDTLGTLVVGVVLGGFGALLARRGYRGAARTHDRRHHGSGVGPHLHFPLCRGRDHSHGTVAYLQTGTVGALFTLSPPVSMIAFASTVLPAHGTGIAAAAVAVYGVSISATMGALGAAGGAAAALAGRHRRLAGAARLVVGLAIVGLAAVLLVRSLPALV